ncbi:3-oxoacyl-ACP synthase, partial [Macrococcoides caseolyticum]
MPAPIATATPAAHAALLGLGVYRPRRVVPNSEIVDRIDSSDEWIRTRSGITARGWAEPTRLQ